jgi:hypothetical protein
MLHAADLRPFRTTADDYQETEDLKKQLRDLRSQRNPFYLTKADLDRIFRWKLRTQYGRNQRHRDTNTDSAYRAVTQAALSITETDLDYEAEVRTGVLTSLRGVGVPVASAILALTDPGHYCVVDFRGWRAVFGEERRTFDIPAYIHYLQEVRKLADDLGWPIQETDLAIWAYDMKTNGPS